MDHPCEKCGASVPSGRPFCPQCRAPQVRVEVIPPAPIVQPELTAATAFPEEMASRTSPAVSHFRIALQAGLLGVMANIIPFGLGLVLTGVLASLLYNRAGGARLEMGKAARLGAMAGAISFAVTSLLTVMAIGLLHAQPEFRQLMLKPVEQQIASQTDPQVQHMLQWFQTPQGFAVILGIAMVGALLLSMLFSAVGAMIAAKLFQNRERPLR